MVLSILPMTGCLCSCYVSIISVHREKVPVCFSTVLALFPTANCNLVIFLARLGELSCGLAGVHLFYLILFPTSRVGAE